MSYSGPDDSGSNRLITSFVSLRRRVFRLFWVALVISNIGTWMHRPYPDRPEVDAPAILFLVFSLVFGYMDSPVDLL